jgi:hypothetical protein
MHFKMLVPRSNIKGALRRCAILNRQTFSDNINFRSKTVQTAYSFRLSQQVLGACMACRVCGSGKQQEFTAEINIHFRGLKNIDNPSVLVFPNVLVCLSCGVSRFTLTESKLAVLAGRAESMELSRNAPTNASESRKRGDENAA